MGSKRCPVAHAGGRHQSVPPSVPPSSISSQGVTCFLGVIGRGRMQVSGAVANMIFAGKVGGCWLLVMQCSQGSCIAPPGRGSNGARAASLSPTPTEASSLPNRSVSNGEERVWGPSPGEASLNWTLILGGRHSPLVTMGMRLFSQRGGRYAGIIWAICIRWETSTAG